MEQIRPIYPQYELISGNMKCTILSYIRLKRSGIWYITPVSRSYEWKREYTSNKSAIHLKQLKEFHREVYCYQHWLKVDPENPTGFIKCPTQEEESDRLLKLYAEGI